MPKQRAGMLTPLPAGMAIPMYIGMAPADPHRIGGTCVLRGPAVTFDRAQNGESHRFIIMDSGGFRWTAMLDLATDSGVAQAVSGSLMSGIQPYLGNLHKAIPQHPFTSIVLVLCSMICGTLIGLERRSRDKPAGLRTLALICVGSTVFTIVSILMVGDATDDQGRIAAQIVTGVGFLGAGAIIRDRGHVLGLTTGATIWVTAAIGMLIGAGYGAGGLGLTLLVLGMLILFRRHEDKS